MSGIDMKYKMFKCLNIKCPNFFLNFFYFFNDVHKNFTMHKIYILSTVFIVVKKTHVKKNICELLRDNTCYFFWCTTFLICINLYFLSILTLDR